MATVEKFESHTIRDTNPLLSPLKTLIETTFYRNNVRKIDTLSQAYKLAKEHPRTIVTDIPIKHTHELGLPEDATILVENSGKIVGRSAKARRIVNQNKEEDKLLSDLIKDSMKDNYNRQFYHATAVVGLDQDFMVKAHLCINDNQANNLLSWLLNFQIFNDEYKKLYNESVQYLENDIYVYFDSEWQHPNYPLGLSYFDPLHNVVCILGMNYFGELKKGTLTLAWATAYRHGFVSCHGGLKLFKKTDHNYVASFFGLSGSGKSTLTHAKHDNKFDIQVLHDDAFIININNGSSIALEPAYFDKTQDYPTGHPEQDYFLTVQNVGVTLNQDNKRVLVTQDIRNGNGRTVKSRYSTLNRVDKINEPINAVYWIMKDDSLPPLLKINDPILASTFGLTLATKRTTAETGVIDPNALVIEPYANPFRVYNLLDDYNRFKELFMKGDVSCYIINTGYYLEQKISKEVTLEIIEKDVNGTNEFRPFINHPQIEYAMVEGFEIPENKGYFETIKKRMQYRIDFINQHNLEHPNDRLPDETLAAIESVTKFI